MSFKDKLRESQGTQNRIPRITTVRNLEIKENDKGKVAFACWDKENEEMVYSTQSLSGILVGKAMVASIYDDDLGAKGGTYRSSYYLTNNDEIALFDNKGKVVVKGTIDDVVVFASNCTGNVSKKQVLLVHTNKGLFGITTNLSLSIGRFSAIDKEHKDIFMDNDIILTPTLYNPDDETINAQTKSFLGKFASKNPPKYAEISIGDVIDENMEGAGESIEMFLEWKKYMASAIKLSAIEDINKENTLGNTVKPSDMNMEEEINKSPLEKKREDAINNEPEQKASNDLPFDN